MPKTPLAAADRVVHRSIILFPGLEANPKLADALSFVLVYHPG